MEKESARAQFKEAARRHHAGDHKGALQLLNALLQEAPDHPELLAARERCLYALAEAGRQRAAAPRGPRRWKRVMVRVGLLLVLGVGLAVGAHYGREAYIAQYVAQQAPEPDWEAHAEQALANRAAARAAEAEAQAEAEAARIREAKRKPGYEHVPESWRATAVNGTPLWEPGIYRNIPCRRRPDFTFDVYIPQAYNERPDENFAFLTICMPVPFPGFLGYEPWAEKNDVILVVMNHVANYTYDQNFTVQDHVLETVFATMRLDPWQGLATGGSGGARCSWDMIIRHPNRFSGIFLIAMGKGDLGSLPPHVAVAHLNGNRDFNAESVRRTVKRFQQEGRVHRHREFPGGHEGGPFPMRVEMLDWLLQTVRSRLR